MTATKFGTFEELIATAQESQQPTMRLLRELILSIDSDAVEVVRLGDRAATYGVGPKKMIEGYTYVLPHKKWVNLGFFRGAQLADPAGLLEGTGKNMRHVKIHTLADVENPAIAALIEAAWQERKEALAV